MADKEDNKEDPVSRGNEAEDENPEKPEGNSGVNDGGADLPAFAAAVAAEAQATTSPDDTPAGKLSNLRTYSSLDIYIYIRLAMKNPDGLKFPVENF